MIERLNFIFSIALKHLGGKRKQTVLVIAGVAVGSMVMIITLALGEGIVTDIQNKIIEISPLVTIKGEKIEGKERMLMKDSPYSTDKFIMSSRIKPDETKEIKPYTEVVSIAEELSEVDAVSPVVIARGVLRYRTLTKQGIIKGIIPEKEAKIANLTRNILTGSLNELVYTKDGTLLGKGLANKLKVKYHDIISVTGESGKIFRLRVVGTFASGFSAVDDNNAFVNLRMAQTINDFSANEVSAIGIHTKDIEKVNEVSEKIKKLTGYQSETWEEANANLLSLFKRNNTITLFLVVFVFIVAGFGIANVLITIVLQKQQDIAIMKSMGVSKRSVEAIFLVEGLILGLIGAIIGAIAGHLVTNLISSLPISYGESAVVRSDHIVTVQKPVFFLLTSFFSILMSALSSLGPARRAARLRPVDILRA